MCKEMCKNALIMRAARRKNIFTRHKMSVLTCQNYYTINETSNENKKLKEEFRLYMIKSCSNCKDCEGFCNGCYWNLPNYLKTDKEKERDIEEEEEEEEQDKPFPCDNCDVIIRPVKDGIYCWNHKFKKDENVLRSETHCQECWETKEVRESMKKEGYECDDEDDLSSEEEEDDE
jgi:hypothetical protein